MDNILHLSEQEYLDFQKRYYALPEAQRKTAQEVVRKLALGGMWRGYAAAVVLVAEFGEAQNPVTHPRFIEGENGVEIILRG